MRQQDLFNPILEAYASSHGVKNADLYPKIASEMGVEVDNYREWVGKKTPQQHNTFTRTVRWAQQSLRAAGCIERMERGQWRLTSQGKYRLTQTHVDRHLVAAHTELGLLIWGNSARVFDQVITEDVHLVLTSPPYLGIQRSYGTFHEEQAYSDMILSVLEPLRRRMVPGANLVLNLSNDSVLKRRFGERSLYLEKLTIRLAEELGLHLMDRMIWDKVNAAPGPTRFVSLQRTHLNSKHEPILVFNTDPSRNLADNRRVLQPYTKQMLSLLKKGGEQVTRPISDHDHRTRIGSFSRDNGGSVLGNVLHIPTNCANKRQLAKHVTAMGLPPHGATFPVALADTLIRFFCPEHGTVVDPFGGWSTVGYAAEMAGRHWITSELNWEYVRAAIERFRDRDGLRVNPAFTALDDVQQRYFLAS